MWKTIKNFEQQEYKDITARVKSSLSTYIKIIEDIAIDINDLSLDEILKRIYSDSKLKLYFSEQKGEEAISKQENIEELFVTAENFIRNNIDSDNIVD